MSDIGAAVEAWDEWCELLKRMGRDVVAPPYPTDDGGDLEMLEHLADNVEAFLGWEVFHADPTCPFFNRQNDLTVQWGGPNADNVYRHARIEPGRRYRITGNMHGCDDFILALRAGFMHNDIWGTKATITAHDLGLSRHDDIDILLGGDEPGAVAIPDGVLSASIREYYFDWTADEPAFFTIECLNPDPPAPVLDGPVFANRVRRAMMQMTDSIERWNAYMVMNRAERIDNSFTNRTLEVSKGLSMARYEFCFWDLEPDQALIVTAEVPEAHYWGAQLYMMGTFELVDTYAHISCRNQSQSTVDSDGKVRYVVCGTDPGAANWLDNANRRNGLCTLRWFWPTGDQAMTPTTEVVALGDVAAALPADHPAVTPADRAADLATRQAHLRHRFRT